MGRRAKVQSPPPIVALNRTTTTHWRPKATHEPPARGLCAPKPHRLKGDFMSRVTLSKPAASRRLALSIDDDSVLALAFEPSTASFERSGGDLLISFDNGGAIRVSKFFTVETGDTLPSFTLADGNIVDGAAFLRSMNPGLDVSLAAGPQSPSGGGINSYADGSGELIGGGERFGALGALDASLEKTFGAFVESASALADAGFGGDALPAGPGGGGGEKGPSYDARAVLYTDARAAGDKAIVTAQALFPGADGKAVPITAADAGNYQITIKAAGASSGWFEQAPAIDQAGCISFSLTAAGLAALKEQNTLFDYFTVTVTDKGSGQEFTYTMQTAATSGREFFSPEQGNTLYGEWHNAHGGLEADGRYSIVSSPGNDHIVFTERFANGSTLYASPADSFSRNNQQSWTGGSDRNSITLGKGMSAAGDANNLVDSSNGAILVDRSEALDEVPSWLYGDGVSAVYARENSQNIIQGHAGSVTIKADGENIFLDEYNYPAMLMGVRTVEDGLNIIDAKTVTIDLRHEYRESPYAVGVCSDDAGRNFVGSDTAGSLVDITVTSKFAAMGLSAAHGGLNDIQAESVLLHALSTGSDNPGVAYGAQATGGSNILTAATLLSVTAEAPNSGSATALSADNSHIRPTGANMLRSDDAITVTAKTAAGRAYALHAGNYDTNSGATDDTNSLSAKGATTITAESTADNACGFYARNGLNEITQSGSVRVEAIGSDSAEKWAIALWAATNGENSVSSNTTATLTATAARGPMPCTR